MFVYQAQKIACDVCFDVFAEWRVKPNDIALSVSACFLWCLLHVI